MLKKLRVQFIALNLILAFLVLLSAFSAVCYLDYQQRVQQVYSALTFTLNEAQSPTVDQIDTTIRLHKSGSGTNATDEPAVPIVLGENSEVADAAASEAEGDDGEEGKPANAGANTNTNTNTNTGTTGSQSQGQNRNPSAASGVEIGGDSGENLIPVAVYLAKSDGTYTALGDYASASIQHTVLLTANAQVLDARTNHGELPDVGLYFERRQTSNGTMIAYADISNVDAWQQLAITLSLVGLIILVAFLLINIFFSWWAFKPVERAWRQQTQFVADASHELKTPLTVILANMAILRADPEATVNEQSQWVESTQTEAERMQSLVNDMLEMARPENAAAAAVGGEFETLDLTDIAEAEVLQFESVAFDKGVTIESNIQPDIYVDGNPARLQRLVSTLIDNACKYADDGGIVDVELEALDRIEAVLRVHNTGPEISEEDLPYVFDRFYRADKARTSGKGGFGLGLAIARGIAREHAGDITVDSSAGEGTTFTVVLPMCEPPEPEEEELLGLPYEEEALELQETQETLEEPELQGETESADVPAGEAAPDPEAQTESATEPMVEEPRE